ncbi:MAG: glycoside hydrolase family 13 protein [Oscillospiraceae bacterium]|nr:glycoside hydrolase family 13 protein [Oscillospiraceae bacterium]
MRILFDSKKAIFKDPFGTLTPGQVCRLNIHVPHEVGAVKARCLVFADGSGEPLVAEMVCTKTVGSYDIFSGSFSLDAPGLYFYHFLILKKDGVFRLFKQGDETNMEAGDAWQVTCTPADFSTPDWAKGAVIYQLFPDRFYRSGSCDLTGKLEPYILHKSWDEEVCWQPTAEGLVLNNDFYGGNFRGITEKMDYIASLGVGILYLNPISKSFSSHRYDTGDYKTPDPMLGTMEDFKALCDAAHSRNIRVILDGVYSHTGSNSLYFNKENTFDSVGAYNSKSSPYYSWYDFRQWPDSYKSWWDFDTLPTVNKMDPAFLEYIITGENSVVAHWLRAGCDGFRLDVADELPNEFLDLLKKRIREIRPDALLLGEVWEDASNKEAYGVRRRYFVDGTLDSVMNYPFRTAIINYLKSIDDGSGLRQTVMTILENYPPQVACCNMNLLGTHDTARILTALIDDFNGTRAEKAKRKLNKGQRELAMNRLYLASVLQYMLPGCPSLYYADETGMEGYNDPFNRRPYPWGRENALLLKHFQMLGQLRKSCKALRLGDTEFIQAEGGRLSFSRSIGGEKVQIYVNHSAETWDIPAGQILYGQKLHAVAPDWLSIGSMGFCIIKE